MTEKHWVTLFSIPPYAEQDPTAWVEKQNLRTEAINMGAVDMVAMGGSCPHHKRYVAFAFTNDDDAMLFKLTFSQYL